MSYHQKIIAGVVAFVVFLAAVAFALWKRSESSSGADGAGATKGGILEETFEPLTGKVVVPEKNQTGLSNNVAVPSVVKESAPDSATHDREFAIIISGNTFIPDTVIVREGDVARITFTAQDKIYDIVQPDQGLRIVLRAGETKLMASQFNRAGKYRFYCETCGGPKDGPVGYLIVAPRSE